MYAETAWQTARLIPIAGIGGADEQERRGASALLAVLTAVREFERAILQPLGAPAGKVSAFCEVPFELADGRRVRVDGLIRSVRGSREWTFLVEVKTGKAEHSREQVEAYLDVVKQEGFDGLLTISNQLLSVAGHHPVEVDGRRYRNVPLEHLSWTRILAVTLMVKDHFGVEDPDQAWILNELIRYLQYDGSGALAFDDMGPEWVPLRAALREGPLRAGEEAAESVAMRWEQLLQHLSLNLAARLGSDVHPVLSRKEADDPRLRTTALSRELVDSGTLSGAVAIPNTVGPVSIGADLRSMVASASVSLDAPDLKRSTARLNWLLRQLRDAPDSLRIDVAFARTKLTASDLLSEVRVEPKRILGATERPPRGFSVVQTKKIGTKRRGGSGGFIRDMAQLIDEFYREVVQELQAWTPPAPQLADKRSEPDRAPAQLVAPDPNRLPSPLMRGLLRLSTSDGSPAHRKSSCCSRHRGRAHRAAWCLLKHRGGERSRSSGNLGPAR